jgi:alpha-ribazole phosphatase/probable phosphoglycerate mutase
VSGESATTVDLLRHGEPLGGKRFRGWRDDPLCERGWEQMRSTLSGHRPWAVVVSSPLLRCAEFAQAFAQDNDLPMELEANLKELGFGAWEGHEPASLLRDDPEALRRFWADPLHNQPPGAEPLLAFQARVVSAWQRVLARHQGRHVLIVAHGGVIRVILCHVLEIPIERLFALDVPYAALSRVGVDPEDHGALPRLMFHAGCLR